MSRLRRTLMYIGITSLVFALLPWLGLGSYSFSVPGYDFEFPRLELFHNEFLWELLSLPLRCVALIAPLRPLVFFQGEGVITVRPLVVSLFWFLVGILLLWVSLRTLPRPAKNDP